MIKNKKKEKKMFVELYELSTIRVVNAFVFSFLVVPMSIVFFLIYVIESIFVLFIRLIYGLLMSVLPVFTILINSGDDILELDYNTYSDNVKNFKLGAKHLYETKKHEVKTEQSEKVIENE